MKAIKFTEYGSSEVLKSFEVDKPIPKDNEVLIKIYATTVTSTDCEIRRSEQLIGRLIIGIFKPRKRFRVLGIELAGKIETIGKNVTSFQKGEKVFGATSMKLSCNAEYICLPDNAVLIEMLDIQSFEEATAVPDGALTALHFLRECAHIKSKQKVLVIGASGSVGTYAIQLAKYFGAEVTGICSSTNVELVKSLGAHKVIDYNKEDYTNSNETYDIIFDTVGKSTFRQCKSSLQEKGIFLETVMGAEILFYMLRTLATRKKAILGFAGFNQSSKDLVFIRQLIEAGHVKPVIDRIYGFEQIAKAHSYVDKGHKKGNVVIKVNDRKEKHEMDKLNINHSKEE